MRECLLGFQAPNCQAGPGEKTSQCAALALKRLSKGLGGALSAGVTSRAPYAGGDAYAKASNDLGGIQEREL